MNKIRQYLLLLIGFISFVSCSEETASEYERVKSAFMQQISGEIDPLQLWKTTVKINTTVKTDSPTILRAFVTIDGENVLTDLKTIPSGGGTVSLTFPQGKGTSPRIVAKNDSRTKTKNIVFTGSAEQELSIDMAPTMYIDESKTRAGGIFDPNEYALHDPDPSLFGKSICGGGYYKDWNVADWNYICDLAIKSKKLEEIGEIVNYELISKGKFSITLLCGYKMITNPIIFGYYYHSPGTYSDITFVDMFDTHKYDFLDSMGLVQYKMLGDDNWYSLNFHINDNPGVDSDLHVTRRGDNVYNSIFISKNYGYAVSNVRGLTYDVDVPEGKRIGFYLRVDDEASIEQFNNFIELGIPTERLKSPFRTANYSAKLFNLSRTYRSWIHDCGNWYFMGMEDIMEGGDFDANDMMFGITDPMDIVLPDIVDPDIDAIVLGGTPDNPDIPTDNPDNPNNPDHPIQNKYKPLSWTIAYEDVHRNPDFDFNDGVIRIEPDYEKETACVTVLAAGIDEKILLHYEAPDGSDMVLGELHEILGSNSSQFVNTTNSTVDVKPVQIDCVPWPQTFTMSNDARRFSLEIVRGNCQRDCTDFLTLANTPGQLPQAILIAGNWNWPKENLNLNYAYNNFNYWAKESTKLSFWGWYETPKSNTFVTY